MTIAGTATARPHHRGGTTRLERVALIAALVLLSSVVLRPSIRGYDGTSNYLYLRTILLDHDLDFTNDYADFDRLNQEDGDPGFRLSGHPTSPTGRPANAFGIGAALLWAPFVVPVHGALELLAPHLADGTTWPYRTAVGVASAFWGCLALLLLYVRLRETHSPRVTLLALGGMVFATSLAFYLWLHGSMSHAVSFFVTTCTWLALERFLRGHRPVQALLVGGGAAMMAASRAQDVLWAIVLMSVFVGHTLRRMSAAGTTSARRAAWLALIAGGAGFAVTFSPQLVVWRILYGSWFAGPAPYFDPAEDSAFALFSWHFVDALFSGNHGALSWHPILIAALVGLGLAAASPPERDAGTQRTLALTGLVGFLLQTWLIGCWSMWWAGNSFGNRFFISTYPILSLGLAALVARLDAGAPRWAVPATLALLVAWNGGLLIQYGAQIIPRDGAVPMREIVMNQFTKVPAFRYDPRLWASKDER